MAQKPIDFAASVRRPPAETEPDLKAGTAPGSTAPLDPPLVPAGSKPAKPRRRRAHGRGPARRTPARLGAAPIAPAGYLASWRSFHGPIPGEDDEPADRPNAFDICPMLNRTPYEEIEDMEDEIAWLGSHPGRMW